MSLLRCPRASERISSWKRAALKAWMLWSSMRTSSTTCGWSIPWATWTVGMGSGGMTPCLTAGTTSTCSPRESLGPRPRPRCRRAGTWGRVAVHADARVLSAGGHLEWNRRQLCQWQPHRVGHCVRRPECWALPVYHRLGLECAAHLEAGRAD